MKIQGKQIMKNVCMMKFNFFRKCYCVNYKCLTCRYDKLKPYGFPIHGCIDG